MQFKNAFFLLALLIPHALFGSEEFASGFGSPTPSRSSSPVIFTRTFGIQSPLAAPVSPKKASAAGAAPAAHTSVASANTFATAAAPAPNAVTARHQDAPTQDPFEGEPQAPEPFDLESPKGAKPELKKYAATATNSKPSQSPVLAAASSAHASAAVATAQATNALHQQSALAATAKLTAAATAEHHQKVAAEKGALAKAAPRRVKKMVHIQSKEAPYHEYALPVEYDETDPEDLAKTLQKRLSLQTAFKCCGTYCQKQYVHPSWHRDSLQIHTFNIIAKKDIQPNPIKVRVRVESRNDWSVPQEFTYDLHSADLVPTKVRGTSERLGMQAVSKDLWDTFLKKYAKFYPDDMTVYIDDLEPQSVLDLKKAYEELPWPTNSQAANAVVKSKKLTCKSRKSDPCIFYFNSVPVAMNQARGETQSKVTHEYVHRLIKIEAIKHDVDHPIKCHYCTTTAAASLAHCIDDLTINVTPLNCINTWGSA